MSDRTTRGCASYAVMMSEVASNRANCCAFQTSARKHG